MLRTCLALILLASVASADPVDPVTDEDYVAVDEREVRLGWLLFWDPVLSGNRNISCGTCHHPKFATGDGVALSLGEGGSGLGPARVGDPDNMPEQRIPRHATALFNLGAKEFRVLFHDGRIEADETKPSGLRTPLDDDMVAGFSGVLSAQTMFPVLSPDEMAGHYGENDVSKAVRKGLITGPSGAWDIIAKRVSALAEYDRGFKDLDPEIAAGRPLDFTDISDAIAAFIAFEWRSDQSPYDAHLRGERSLSGPALQGKDLFYGPLGCSDCHAGPFQTDHSFHAMGVPQIGPGKAARFESHQRDEGRYRVTGRIGDLYKFRTPSLRNVTRTSPYGHSGAYKDLRVFLKAHLRPSEAVAHYDVQQAILPVFEAEKPDFAVMKDGAEAAAISAAVVDPARSLSASELDALVAFLESLTDEAAIEGRLGIPDSVPSGLPIDR